MDVAKAYAEHRKKSNQGNCFLMKEKENINFLKALENIGLGASKNGTADIRF